ncbi:hypothetical protein T02_11790 [Trichinella nativa]|uniref:Uncharacterized protein n=1 Tax=Trichinella nativa TaxID=6335 RepID=A0A0V1KQD5_9BILA|nr:hypothetical protein T02_11790 [Trichinella nativa]
MASKVVRCLSQYTGKRPIWNYVETDRQWLKFGIGYLENYPTGNRKIRLLTPLIVSID